MFRLLILTSTGNCPVPDRKNSLQILEPVDIFSLLKRHNKIGLGKTRTHCQIWTFPSWNSFQTLPQDNLQAKLPEQGHNQIHEYKQQTSDIPVSDQTF